MAPLIRRTMFLPPEIDAFLRPLLSSSALALVAGLCLLGWGEQVYRLAILAPGMLVGLWLGREVAVLAHLPNTYVAVLSVGLGFLGALVCRMLEAWAVRALGALSGVGVSAAVYWMVTDTMSPWWLPVLGGIVGALVFPRFVVWLLRVVSAFAGGLLVASASGQPGNIFIVGGLTGAGIVFQTWFSTAGGAKAKKPKKDKKDR